MVKVLSYILLSGLVLVSCLRPEDQSVLRDIQHLKNLRPLGTEFAEYFKNITQNGLSPLNSRLSAREDSCLSDMYSLMLALRSGQLWAMKMIDSWGSIPSGIFTGNVYDLGNFDECLKIKKDTIQGKYCFLEVNPDQLPRIVKLLSARANSRALFRVVENKSNPNVIECLHGIRGMSLCWVLFLHQYASIFYSPNINRFSLLSWIQRPFASFFLQGTFSVDSFFFIGGLLVSLISLRLMERNKGRFNVPMMYLHRLIRILPILAMAILVYTQLTGVLVDGPLFIGGSHDKSSCAKTWYMTLLFVVNFADDMCLDHTWYLAVDMQLFLISPIFLFALHKWGKKAAAGIFVLIVLLSGCLFATMMVNNYSIKNLDLTLQKQMYFYTHTHAAPWLIGFLFGYFLYLNKGKQIKLHWVAVWSGWILCLAMLFTSIFALFPIMDSGKPWLATTLELSCFYTLTRVGWPMAICWVVFACMQGYGSLANSFLSSPLWQPLSRLSYSVYMWHSFIQGINQGIARTNTYFSNYQVMLDFWSTMGFTVLFSYLLYLLIEAPIGGLDIFLRPQKKPSAEIKPIKDDSEPVQETQIDDVDSSKPKELEATDLNSQTSPD